MPEFLQNRAAKTLPKSTGKDSEGMVLGGVNMCNRLVICCSCDGAMDRLPSNWKADVWLFFRFFQSILDPT